MQGARARWSTETVVTTAVALFGLTTLGGSVFRSLPSLTPVMLVAGAAWIVFLSL